MTYAREVMKKGRAEGRSEGRMLHQANAKTRSHSSLALLTRAGLLEALGVPRVERIKYETEKTWS